MDFTTEASGAVVAGALQGVSKAQEEIEDVIVLAGYFADLERISYVLDFVRRRISNPELEPNERLFYKAVKRKCIELDADTRAKMRRLFNEGTEND